MDTAVVAEGRVWTYNGVEVTDRWAWLLPRFPPKGEAADEVGVLWALPLGAVDRGGVCGRRGDDDAGDAVGCC